MFVADGGTLPDKPELVHSTTRPSLLAATLKPSPAAIAITSFSSHGTIAGPPRNVAGHAITLPSRLSAKLCLSPAAMLMILLKPEGRVPDQKPQEFTVP